MHRWTATRLRCPCGGALSGQGGANWEEDCCKTAFFVCGGCGEKFSVAEGIGCFLPPARLDQSPDAAKKASERNARDAQVADYDRMVMLKVLGRREIPLTLRYLEPTKADRVLEGGCGTGRMTRALASRCGWVTAIDFSAGSLTSNQSKLKASGVDNADLFQADLCHLPFESGTFDRTVSCQVLEHVPSAESRRRAVRELVRVTKPGGTVVISAYRDSWLAGLFGPKEGEHAGGIYYYRFGRKEFEELISENLNIQQITGSLQYIHLAKGIKPN